MDRPENRRWQREGPGSLLKDLRQTYGLITRVQDPATGHSVLTVSGLVLGTRAAVECLLDSDCMQAAESLGANFSRTNAQVVVRAAVIGEDAGTSTGRGGAFMVIEALCGAHLSALRRDSRPSVSTAQD